MKEIRFKPDVNDLIAAQRLFQLLAIKRSIPFVVTGLSALPLLVWLLDGVIDWGSVGKTWIVILVIVALLTALSRYVSIPRHARKTIRLDKAFGSEISVRWDEENLYFSHTKGQWEASLGDFPCAIADRDNLLLFRQTNMYHFLPTRAFSSGDERGALLASLRSHGVVSRWPPK